MNISAKKLLLLDGLGAFASAILLSQVLARFDSLFGMPREILYFLSGIAICFAVFSLTSHVYVKSNFKRSLSIIFIANMLYCLATCILIGIYFDQLTWLGIAYFIGEITLVSVLIYAEIHKLKRLSNK